MDNKDKQAQQESRDDKATAHARSRGLGGYKTDPNNIPGRFGESHGKDSVDVSRYINPTQNSPLTLNIHQQNARRMRQMK